MKRTLISLTVAAGLLVTAVPAGAQSPTYAPALQVKAIQAKTSNRRKALNLTTRLSVNAKLKVTIRRKGNGKIVARGGPKNAQAGRDTTRFALTNRLKKGTVYTVTVFARAGAEVDRDRISFTARG